MIRLAFIIFIVALLTRFVQGFSNKIINNDPVDVPTHSILIILKATPQSKWTKRIREILSNTFYKENICFGLIFTCSKSVKNVEIPFDLQHKIKVFYSKDTPNVFNIGIRKFYDVEDYVCVFDKCIPKPMWDVECLNAMVDDSIILTSVAFENKHAFPCLYEKKGFVHMGKFKEFYTNNGIVPCVSLCPNFVFGTGTNLIKINWDLKKFLLNSFDRVYTTCFCIVKGETVRPLPHKRKIHKNAIIGYTMVKYARFINININMI